MEQESEHQPALSSQSLARLYAYEAKFGRRVQVDAEPDPRARASLYLGEHGRPDRLLVADRHLEHEEHLIAHELGHAELVFDSPPKSRQTLTLNLDAVRGTIKPELLNRQAGLSVEELAALVRSTGNSVGSRALSYPEDVLIERSLADQPALAVQQRQSLASQAFRLGRGLQALERSSEVASAMRAVTALDGGYVLWLADHLGKRDAAEPVANLSHAADARFFHGLLRELNRNDLAACRQATDAIMQRLGLRGWYGWRVLDL